MKELPAGTFSILSHPIMQFDDLMEAHDFITQAEKNDPLKLGDPLRIVLGDIGEDGEDPHFWVATEDDAGRLVQAGYSYGDDDLNYNYSSSLTL